MNTGNIKIDTFMHLLSRNLVPSQSKLKKDKQLKGLQFVYKNPRPQKFKS